MKRALLLALVLASCSPTLAPAAQKYAVQFVVLIPDTGQAGMMQTQKQWDTLAECEADLPSVTEAIDKVAAEHKHVILAIGCEPALPNPNGRDA